MGMGCMGTGPSIGPRFVPVMRIGSDICTADSRGVYSPGLSIGRVSGLPFDSTVKDIHGNAVGKVEDIAGRSVLQRW